MIVIRALITLSVTAIAAFGGVKFMDSVGPDIHSEGGNGSATVNEVEASSDESLVEPENFGKVLSTIKKDFGAEAKLVNLRLDPSRVNVQVPQGSSKTFVLQYNNEGEETSKVETSVDLSSNPNVASITRVPAGAPKRIMKKIVKKTGMPIDNLSYMVITTFGDGVGWYISLKEGEETTWRAELNGKKVRAQ